MRKIAITLGIALAVPAASAGAHTLPADPLGSPMWSYRAQALFGDAAVVFDPRVRMIMPAIAENQHQYPVMVDARALGDVRRIVILIDLNPIPIAVDYRPLAARAVIGTRIKLDQRTPVRAAVLTADGVWHVAGGWIDAAGGGCSAPPVSRARGDWAQHVGEMRGQAWREGTDTRLRVTFRHPMDTGLVDNIPAYNIDTVSVHDAAGKDLGEIGVAGSVSEDPAFTLVVDGAPGALTVEARDTDGRTFGGVVPAP